MPSNEITDTALKPKARKALATTVDAAAEAANEEYAQGVENGFVVLSQGCTVTDPISGQSFPKGHGDVFPATLLTEPRAKKLLFSKAIRPALEDEAGLTHVDLPDTVGTSRASADAISLQAQLTDKDMVIARHAARIAELERQNSALASEIKHLKTMKAKDDK